MTEPFFEKDDNLQPPVGKVRDHLETAIYLSDYAELFKQPQVRELAMADELPLPDPVDREGYYGPRHLEYWLSGCSDFLKVKTVGGFSGLDDKRIFELGGCTARAARHYIQQTKAEIWLSDINLKYISWLQRYFPKSLRCFRNDFNPSLPIADDFFDIVLAYSVFTHIDAFELPWLLEVHRILKSGGKAFMTILDENSWRYVGQHDWLMKSILKAKFEELNELLKTDMPSSRLSIKYSDEVAYNCNIFLRSDYVNSAWGRFFTSIEIRPLYHNYQTMVTLTK